MEAFFSFARPEGPGMIRLMARQDDVHISISVLRACLLFPLHVAAGFAGFNIALGTRMAHASVRACAALVHLGFVVIA